MDLSLRRALDGLPGLPGATGAAGAIGPTGPAGGGSGAFSVNAADAPFNAKGDGRRGLLVGFAIGDTLVSAQTGSGLFTANDIGKVVAMTYLVGSVQTLFFSAITQFIDVDHVRVADACPVSITTTMFVGTDDTDALNAGVDYISTSALIRTLQLNPGIFLTRTGVNLYKSRTAIRGAGDAGNLWYIGYPGSPYSGYAGTILVYVGQPSINAYTLKVVDSVLLDDIWNCRASDMSLEGFGLAGNVFDHRATLHCSFANMTSQGALDNAAASSWRCGSLTHESNDYPTGAASRINCTYANNYTNIHAIGSGAGAGWVVGGLATYAGTNTCFCNFTDCWGFGGAAGSLLNQASDDNAFFNCTFGTINLIPISGKTVETQTFYGLLAQGGNINADGIGSRRNKIYGLSGTDNAVQVNITNGAQLFYDYLGDGGSISDINDKALNRTAPLKIAGPHMLDIRVYQDACYTPGAAPGAYAGKIKVKVWTSDTVFTYKWISVYD